MFNMLYFYVLFFFTGLMVFFFNYKYLLINLLSIEYMMLCLLSMLIFVFLEKNKDMFFIMMFLVFMVCEGVLGLSMLISMVRNYGTSNLFNLFFIKI